MKNKTLIASVLLMALVMVSLVSAFGVSSPYWDENPLVLTRGESKTVNLNLQNMVGEEDVNVKAELLEGAEITSLPQETFTVKAGTSNTMVPIDITMPKDAEPGEVKQVSIEFKTVSDDAGGIAMGTGMSIYFDVIASEEVKEDNTLLLAGIVVLVLAVVLFILLKKKK